ncbi:hypothetical protein HPO96_02305 [Kribbella sandramycini]|uniref:ABC-2 type transport system permease protein n=1 Tax=Kribbella sandramycini TaxID=60450 RepID=A0A7Y4KV19_9ACTN|nr:DUF6297 family protein [Kribbella sandramycini]MBB6568338.1 hypothetical protein [Kribbella sandramycini]NOL39070.1 hypothetical protein [Kribbella sandramycini]
MTAPDGPVVYDPADFGAIPTARSMRRWMRTTRRKHADRTFGQLFEDIYLVVFTIAMAAATGGSVVKHLNAQMLSCTSAHCVRLWSLLPWILVPLLTATTLRVLLSVGPVAASRATGFWLLATPVNRTALLRPTYWRALAGVLVFGGVLSTVAWAVLGGAPTTLSEATIVTTALLLVAACLAVWAQQTARRTRWTLRFADLLLVVASIPSAWLAVLRFNEDLSPVESVLIDIHLSEQQEDLLLSPETVRLLTISSIAVVVLAVLILRTARTLDRLSRASVIAGGELLAGVAGAASSLDLSMLADVVAGRHWRLAGRARSRRGRGAHGGALVHREFLRILRWPRRLVIAFALLVVPYAMAGAGFDPLVPIAAGFAGFAAIRPLLDGLRSVCRSPGLVRALGYDLRELRVLMAVAPGVITAVWALAAYPVIGSAAGAFAVGAGVLAGAVRQASARPPSYAGPLVASPMGAIPPGLFSQPIRGFDVLLICLLPVLLGLGPTWVLAIPVLVLTVMFAIRPKTD